MNKNKYIHFLLIFVLMVSCESGENKKEYYKNGILKRSSYLKNGIKTGIEVTCFENGNLFSEISWKNGKKQGVAKYYYEIGELEERSSYFNGKLNGKYILYYKNGSLMQEGRYRDNIRNGLQKSFRRNGSLIAEKMFLNIKGKEILISYVNYDSTGKIMNESMRVKMKKNKENTLLVELLKPNFDSTHVIIGKYDSVFNLKDFSSLDTLIADNHRVKLKMNDGVIRGIVDNFKVTEKVGVRDTIIHSYLNFEYITESSL